MSQDIAPIMSVGEINAFLNREFPQVFAEGAAYRLISVGPGTAQMELHPDESHLRPGGTISGPTMFTLADVAAYVAILAHIGPVALAVTTNLNINFLRLPQPRTLTCTCRILKLGKRLAVVDATLWQDSEQQIVAHAVATYSIPPRG